MFSSKSESDMISRAKEVIKRVDLKDSDDKYPSEISGGMKKRVAIARAIVLNPKYLFCDEPNSGLDPKTAIIIDKLIQEITVEYNITTIINTHDMNSVMEIGDKIIFLVKGKKIWEGNNQEILNTEEKLYNLAEKDQINSGPSDFKTVLASTTKQINSAYNRKGKYLELILDFLE